MIHFSSFHFAHLIQPLTAKENFYTSYLFNNFKKISVLQLPSKEQKKKS